jgi:hypothetical protein
MNVSNNFINLSNNSFFNLENETLYCGWNAGFFSNCTIALRSLIDLLNRGITPRKVDFSSGFQNYKTKDQIDEKVDLYPYYFSIDTEQKIPISRTFYKPFTHGIYKNLDYDSFTPFLQKYFELSNHILDIQNMLVEKYKFDPMKTISVVYRGTDKHQEVKLASPQLYLVKAEALLKQNSDFKILIQTDQKQVRDLFLHHFKEQCVSFEEMCVTEGKIVPHLLDENSLGLNRFEFGKMVLAVTHLISKCKFIVNHTGNMALWTCLFRGNATNMFQFDRKGNLVSSFYWIRYYPELFFDGLRVIYSTFTNKNQ